MSEVSGKPLHFLAVTTPRLYCLIASTSRPTKLEWAIDLFYREFGAVKHPRNGYVARTDLSVTAFIKYL